MIPNDFDTAHAEVIKLIQAFADGFDHYDRYDYNESQVRKDFIDKFFIALGWDVNHEQQRNPYAQEVKVEPSVTVAARVKKADYSFALAPNYRAVRFFVEAKKPAIPLDSPQGCFQTARYGYNSDRVAVSILTNFKELYIIDCRFRPDIATAVDQIHKRYSFTDFYNVERFAEIYYLFGRQAVQDGALENYAKDLPKPKGRAKQLKLFSDSYREIDDSFLATLEEFRGDLARMFKRNNSYLDSESLTEAVQRTLDRLVFIRFLEDKLIEPETILDKFGFRPKPWAQFIAKCREFDRTYNGIIFKFHSVIDDPEFVVDDRVFLKICDDFAGDHSPYHFNYIPIHILGSIYERFLGNVIEVKGKNASIVPKPEVRKAGGVFYTPQYVVDYIVRNTIGRLLVRKTPSDVANMRFADIACGSGSFLLGVYEYLLSWHTAYYNKRGNGKEAREAGCVINEDGTYHLSFEQKKEILVNNVYGVDVDRQAHEVTQLSLFLKLLEEETLATKRRLWDAERKAMLPSLSTNVVCGNALVDWDVSSGDLLENIDSDKERRLNPMSFERKFPQIFKGGGFDAIVGNPPYDVLEKEREDSRKKSESNGSGSGKKKEKIVINYHDDLIRYVNKKPDYVSALGGKLNLYRFFIVRAVRLTKPGGRIGMIIPLSLLGDISCAKTRAYFLAKLGDLKLDCFPQKDNAKKRIFAEAKLSTMVFNGYHRVVSGPSSSVDVKVYPANSFDDSFIENTIKISDLALIDEKGMSVPLVDSENWEICRKIYRHPEIVPIGKCAEIQVNRGEINQTIYREYINVDPTGVRLVKGVEIGQYIERESLSQGFKEWFNEKRFLKNNSKRVAVEKVRIATQRITGVDERLRIVATLINPRAYFADSVNSITLQDDSNYRIEYLLGLLNSNLFQWRFKITSTNNNVGTNELEAMPFRLISFDHDPEAKAKHDLIVRNVCRLIETKRDIANAKLDGDKDYLSNKCEKLNSEINETVYSLYGIDDDEIDLIEETQFK